MDWTATPQLRKAEKLLRQGRLDAAIAEYRSVVEDQPSDWNTANTLGDLYVRAGQIDSAAGQYLASPTIWPPRAFCPRPRRSTRRSSRSSPTTSSPCSNSEKSRRARGCSPMRRRRSQSGGAARGARRPPRRGGDAGPPGALDTGDFEARLAGARAMAELSPTGFLALKALFALIGVFVGSMLGSSRGFGGLVLGAAMAGALGFLGPDYVLTLKARSRKEKIRADLPDALDLLAVSVEAGLGFDGALAKLTEHMEGPLAEEFALTLGEMRIGESRSGGAEEACPSASTRRSSRASCARSSRPTSSASRSAGSCASRPPTRA